METFWSFRLRFRRAYDYAYDSVFQFPLGHKRSCDSDYETDYDSDYDSDSVANENQPLERKEVNDAIHKRLSGGNESSLCYRS